MGANIVRRLMRNGHECVVYDVNPDSIKQLQEEGATGGFTLERVCQQAAAATRGLGDDPRGHYGGRRSTSWPGANAISTS
jgi:3-hydroxyisobutyrate dehydrogenase-like beta-hydroxyacid dehydrogenase